MQVGDKVIYYKTECEILELNKTHASVRFKNGITITTKRIALNKPL